jgi:hypothetical protein
VTGLVAPPGRYLQNRFVSGKAAGLHLKSGGQEKEIAAGGSVFHLGSIVRRNDPAAG